MLAILMPGQGSQTPGMLEPWLNEDTKKLLATWSLHIDLDLMRLGTIASAEEIKDTANAQPLIVATGLISAHLLNIKNFSIVSGHSVGEITAAAISEVISASDALALVRQRGLAMAKAASQVETGMAAVLGGDRNDVLKSLANLELAPANDNGAGQIVAAGALDALDMLIENPPAGARVRALAVAGAFHTKYMQSAVNQVETFAANLTINSPKYQLISNKDGQVVKDGNDAVKRIVNQIANPVRWDLCMESLAQLGVTGAIELAPAGTLVGLLKRATPTIETFALKSPADLSAANEFAQKHGA
jgi:[acyl-carrier-protein] S-malonyltransferase